MAVFTAFSDETEVNGIDGEFVFGGYIAKEDEWPCVAEAWQDRVLNGPPPIPFLHMREIRDPEWREKFGLSWRDADGRVQEAAWIMQSFGNIAAIASTIRRSQLRDVFHRRYRRRKDVPVGIDQPDYFCFMAYAANTIGHVYGNWPEAEKVDFVTDRKKGVTHHIAEFKEQLQKMLEPELRRLVGDLIPASKEDRIPLQSADVLLWHIQRYYAAGQDQYKMDRDERIRAAELVDNGDMGGTIHTWETERLQAMADKWDDAGVIPKLRVVGGS